MRTRELPGAPLAEPSVLRWKIIDLGNACFREKHFTEMIQTRQYRCPEVILGSGYDTPSDMWSLGCLIFEAATGDHLFNPKAGKSWPRDEDHLALCMELLGKMPRKLALSGKHAGEFFNKKGELRNIRNLKFWGLDEVLIEKYKFDEGDAAALAAFVKPMLELDPNARGTASELLAHPWLAASRGSEAGAENDVD